MNKFRTVSVLAAAAIVVTACTDAPKSTASAPSAGGTPTSVYAQRISWRDCGNGFQCGSFRVPLDYAHSTGRLLSLPVIRLPAEGGQRKGSLVLNPGGPGGSGVEFARGSARSFGADLRRSFDIVGFDPRGVGQSRPSIRCMTGKQLDRFFDADTSPPDQAALNNLVDVSKEFAEGCKDRVPSLLPYVGTANAARDIDVLRAALGDKGLTYYGASYGTFLGAYYAQEFPKHVRALVLDGAIDPKLSADDINIEQAKGFDTATNAFAADCVKTKDCPLGSGSTDEAIQRLSRLFDQARTKPLYNGLKDGRIVNNSMVELGVAAALYNKQTWPVLKLALKSAIDQNDGTTLLRLGDLLIERHKDGSYSNQTEANMAINCIDKPYARDLSAWKDQAAKAKKDAPLFGEFVVWGTLPCAYWPVQDNTKPQAFPAAGAKPILVVGTTRDPATPYKWAQGLASQLQSGVLLSLDGDGHTAYLQGNPCITTAVDRYLLNGTPPRKNTMCH